MLPFIRDSITSNQSLESNPLEKRFHHLLEALDKSVFSGNGIVTVFEEDKQYLQLSGENEMSVSYCFMYSTMNLTIQIIFNDTNKIVNKQFNNIKELSESAQQYLAAAIEKETRDLFLSH